VTHCVVHMRYIHWRWW